MGLLLLSWAVPLTLVAFTRSIFDEPVGLKTWLVIFGCIIAAVCGILAAGRRDEAQVYDVPAKAVVWLGAAGVMLALAYWALAGTPQTTLEETRKSVHDGTFVQSNTVSYLSQFGGAVSLLAVALATQVRKPLLLLGGLLAVSCAAWTGVVLNTGGRVFLFSMISVGLAGMVGRYAGQVFRWRSLCGALLVFIPVFAANVWFVQKRMQTWFDESTLDTTRLQKAETLVGSNAGIVLNSDYATTSVWLLLQFTSDPVYYLDYYVKYVDLPLHGGLYQFSVISNRVPGYDWQSRRDIIDTMYEPLGVKTNVWGTGIRDVMVDFGAAGAVVFFAMMGLAAGGLRRVRLYGGRILYAFVLMWIMYSPFNSPITLRPLQIAGFMAVLGLGIEKMLSRAAGKPAVSATLAGGPRAEHTPSR